jgi:hypothetical protein
MSRNNKKYIDTLKKEIEKASENQNKETVKYVVSIDLQEDELRNMKQFISDLRSTASTKSITAKSLIYDILKNSGLFEYKSN